MTDADRANPPSRGPHRGRAAAALLAVVVVAAGLTWWGIGDGDGPPPERAQDTPSGSAEPAVGPTTVPPTAASPPPRSPRTGPALVIKHGWDVPDPVFMRDNATSMDASGFDGVVLRVDDSPHILSDTPVGYEELQRQLAPLGEAAFSRLTHNFVIIYTGELDSYGGDWSTPLANIANLARAARETGLAGIVYDNEAYFTDMSDWSEEESDVPLESARAQAMGRGREVAGAVVENWPDAVLLTLIGPWLSDPATAEHYDDGDVAYNDVSFANELIGPFFLGMVEVAADRGLDLVDGGELYTARDEEQFEHAYSWMKDGFAAQSDLVPDDLRHRYGDIVDVGFGLFDRPWLGEPMDDDVWATTIELAIERTDRYVWLYTEDHDWWGVGHPEESVPPERREVTQRAIDAAGG